jgi:hypothetical protein
MHTKTTVEFDLPKTWVISEKTCLIKRIESSCYGFNKHSASGDNNGIRPYSLLRNVMKNVALLPNASFMEAEEGIIIARISDLQGTSLIQTDWEIPAEEFALMAQRLIVKEKVEEHHFYIIASAS